MSSKRKMATLPGRSAKSQRKVINLDFKMKIIKEYEAGKKVNAIASHFGLGHSTVSTILKDKDKIKDAIKASTGYNTIITRQRKGLIPEMEKLLAIWFDDQIQKRMPITHLIIQTKARDIFDTLKEREGGQSTETFVASYGWFQRFRKRFNLHNCSFSGELTSSDVDEAKKFVDEFYETIVKGNYLPEQLFNVDETTLFWKKMPERSYIHKEAEILSGFKSFKDRLVLLLGGNAAGFKLKPFIIYRSENPSISKHISKEKLPVYYRANTKPWMTQSLFEDWFNNCFVPSVEQYYLEKEIPFKTILLLDNVPGHPQHLDDLHPNVKVVYLPKNTTAILQPMEQGAITTFKAHYLRTTFSKALTATENDEVTLRDFWKSYNILNCITNIELAWKEVTEKCMKGIWKTCLKHFINESTLFENDKLNYDIQHSIVELANNLHLDIERNDIQELIKYDEGELTNEDLIELEAQQHLEEKNESVEMEEIKKKFTLHGLAGVFSKINAALLELEAMDHNVERFKKVERQINEVLRCYREIYEEKKKSIKQSTLDVFFSKAPSSLPGPSTVPDSVNNDCD